MSHQETHIGVLRKIDLKGKTVEQWMQDYPHENGYTDVPDGYYDWEEYMYTNYVITHKNVWIRGTTYATDDDPHFCMLIPKEDGTYIYATSFYNGGACLNEMLEDELKKINL